MFRITIAISGDLGKGLIKHCERWNYSSLSHSVREEIYLLNQLIKGAYTGSWYTSWTKGVLRKKELNFNIVVESTLGARDDLNKEVPEVKRLLAFYKRLS